MGRRLGDLARALGALVCLILLLLGPPAGLVTFVGWPLPESIPSLTAITEGARSGVPDEVLINTLAILGWLAWMQLALTVIIEAVAVLRNVSAPALPGLPGMQLGIGRLMVTAALLLGGLTNRSASTPFAAVPGPAAAEPIALVLEPEPAQSPATAATARRAASSGVTSEQASQHTYVVQRHDSWWGVAEALLGDGTRWRELRDLNVGRAMNDGYVITGTTDAMNDGWMIRVPAGAGTPLGASESVTAEDVIVEPGDNLWDLSEEHLEASIEREAADGEIGPYWQEVISANQPGLGDPNLIHPGQAIHLPGRGESTPAAETTAPPVDLPSTAGEEGPGIPPPTRSNKSTSSTTEPTIPPATTPRAPGPVEKPAEEAAAAPHEPDQEEGVEAHTVGLLGTAGALLAAGLAAAVARRRRRREIRLPPGAIAPDPPEQLVELRADIVRQADLDLVAVLAHATSTVASELATRRSRALLRIIQASDERIDVFLSEPLIPAPVGWRTDASGNAWVLEAEHFPEIVDDAGTPTHPLLVSLGQPDANGQLYIDLEAEGLVNVRGDDDEVAGFVRSMIHELSVSPFAGTATVFLVGDCHGSPTNDLDRVHRFGSWDRVADTVLAWAHQTRDVLAAHRWPTPAVGRSDGERSDDLAPMVVVLDGEPDDERFAALCTTIADAIVPVVVVGVGTNIDAATDVLVADGHLSIPRLGLTCAAQTISAETAEQVVELLDDSERIPEQLELVEETANEHPREQPRVGEPYLDPPFDVLVRVLGEIEVLGAEHPLTPMQTSVFVYLALHSPVASETIQDAIWTMPTENRKKRLANTISEIRPSIGPDQLPPASDGKYRVGPGVKTDLELFESRVAHAAEQPAELAMETLRGALELVSGPVFTYRNSDRTSYVWVDHENWISSTELKVTCTAERLACLYLVAGDHDGAVWAASVGLKAAPTHSRLTEVLMRAHHAAGDRRAIEQVFSSHVNALQKLDIDAVDPALLDTYDDLRGGRRTAAG